MGGVTVWMRCAYKVTGQRADPGRPRARAVEPHLVSECLPIEVATADADDHPIVLTIDRRLNHRDGNDLHNLGTDYREQPGRQVLEFRALGEGIMRRVLAPGGIAPLRADGFAAAEEAVRRRSNVSWDHHPLATADVPRPATAPDRSSLALRDVREDGREAALLDLVHRGAGMRVIDGELWCACPVPLWHVSVSPHIGAVSLQAVVPGHDLTEVVDVDSSDRARRVTTAVLAPDGCLDVRVPTTDLSAILTRLHPGLTVVACEDRIEAAPWVPEADSTRMGLVALGSTLDAHHAAQPRRVDPEIRLSLAQLRAIVHRMDTGRLEPDEARDRALDVAARLSTVPFGDPAIMGDRGDPADVLLRVRLWEVACRLDATHRPAPDEELATLNL